MFIILLFTTLLIAENEKKWFITEYEYGKMLYKSPRGIGCIKCHGENAEGKIITSYITTKKNGTLIVPVHKTIKTNSIQNVSLERLKEALFHDKKLLKKKKNLAIMPKYDYLTEEEIKAIYIYLKELNAKKETRRNSENK